MTSTLKTHVVKITGVPDELIRLLDERVTKQHYGGRAEYLRELMRRDLLNDASTPYSSERAARTVAEAKAVFARIEQRDTSKIEPLAPGADSREAIYGERG